MITYDLNSPGQDYDNVIDKIKECSTGVWCAYWKSAYLIKSNMSANNIIQALKPFLDNNDSLIVIEVKSNYNGWLTDGQRKYIDGMLNSL